MPDGRSGPNRGLSGVVASSSCEAGTTPEALGAAFADVAVGFFVLDEVMLGAGAVLGRGNFHRSRFGARERSNFRGDDFLDESVTTLGD